MTDREQKEERSDWCALGGVREMERVGLQAWAE